MSNDFDEERFFRLRKEGKTYISKVFTFGSRSTEKLRNVHMVMDGSDQILIGEIDGSLCLRISGEKRKTQVTAIVSQDEKRVKRVTLQTFKNRADGSYAAIEKDSFTFRGDELKRLFEFLSTIGFIDLSNSENFHIEDISQSDGPKAIIDASDRSILHHIKTLSGSDRERLLGALAHILLENYFMPGDLERQIEAFVEHYNHRRYHESIHNVTPADAYFGRAAAILKQRERIKRQTIQHRRLRHRKLAA